MYSCEIRKAAVLCAFFEISLNLTNYIGAWLYSDINKAYNFLVVL